MSGSMYLIDIYDCVFYTRRCKVVFIGIDITIHLLFNYCATVQRNIIVKKKGGGGGVNTMSKVVGASHDAQSVSFSVFLFPLTMRLVIINL